MLRASKLSCVTQDNDEGDKDGDDGDGDCDADHCENSFAIILICKSKSVSSSSGCLALYEQCLISYQVDNLDLFSLLPFLTFDIGTH